MPIVANDIQNRLSGGGSNADVNASIGGAKSSVSIIDATLNNLFDQVSSAEASAGDTEYRCIYVHNNHGTLTMENTVIWIDAQTSSGDTSMEIGLGAAAINATEAAIANENTAPAGVTFSAPATEGAALSIGNIPPGEHKAIWIKRIVDPAAAAANDSGSITVKCDTAA